MDVVNKEWIKKNDPEYLNTFDWEQCPEGYDGICYCQDCRGIMAEDEVSI